MTLVIYPANDNLHDLSLRTEGTFTVPIHLLLQRTKSLELSKNILDHSLPRYLLESQVLLSFGSIDSISSLIDWSLLVLGNLWDGSVKIGSGFSGILC
jgi:hypothetical protein